MKNLLIFSAIFFFIFKSAEADEVAGSGLPTPWELLILKPESRNDLRIQIDGYLKVSLSNDGKFRFQLFTDKDSLEKSRSFKSIEIEGESFSKALDSSGVRGQKNIQNLNGVFITIKAKFQSSSITSEQNLLMNEYQIGILKEPFYGVFDFNDTIIKSQ